VENGVDLEYYNVGTATDESQLLFLASLDWYPNLDALNYLLDYIMPVLYSRRPGVRLRIVGRRPPKSLAARIASLQWAELVADVADVRPYLRQAAVVVVPLRIGGGSRLKILESLAAGKAVVSTSIGAEGLSLVPGEHIRIADEPEEFVRQILELLESPKERERLGANGRGIVAERYGWDKMASALESAWFGACRPINVDGSSTTCRQATEAEAP
jgi:glycosyltransferase involved in cell wall biosynthesis